MKRIIAEIRDDTIEPYKGWESKSPFVIESTHPRFGVGCRLDWGFVQLVIADGYTVEIRP